MKDLFYFIHNAPYILFAVVIGIGILIDIITSIVETIDEALKDKILKSYGYKYKIIEYTNIKKLRFQKDPYWVRGARCIKYNEIKNLKKKELINLIENPIKRN